jgi:hypothetical protein
MTSQAQSNVFDSGSTGSDGALNYLVPGTYIFDPRAFNPPLDVDGDRVFHFTTITIAPGVTVTLSAKEINGPVYWLATGPVQIDGIVDLSGQLPYEGLPIPSERKPSVPGPGGYPGGVWRSIYSPASGAVLTLAQTGAGPGGGLCCDYTWHQYGRAGHAERGGSSSWDGASYGNNYLLPLLGGSGGAGSTYFSQDFGSGGGAGGGALLLASSTSISINGAILSRGSYRGTSYSSGTGGSGGSIHLVSPIISGTGRLDATGCSGCYHRSSHGRIRIEAFQQAFMGVSEPAPAYGTPIRIQTPSNWPSIRIASIAGASVPQFPSGDFSSPDVTLSLTTSATVIVEAQNVPVGSIATLYVHSENAPDQVLASSPLEGSFSLSTTTMSVVLPYGYSYVYVRAKWTP